ncbi:dihydrolipoamide acetyltransferase family protein [Ktedonobacter racemifer]|uniref:Dihydrolipoamide acetyltransferase component of pyruvate dehydrogenase complex n=1 Tax=Ktedonobacter racemifer DSM 44963 TaxID=485913 RepID=D6TM37_KTERA|nr:dihydrolipoamide acetyltransferase family protein [Ktedonobacter racemifer]EFH86837.1 catalytic domain of component of various dehydrogenase complexes [Ktedonobacter racemifer DSM 44963]
MPDVSMPRLSDTMQEGTITRWLKKSGDQIKRGDIIAEVETDKANMEIEAYDSGILEQILIKEGEVAPIGQTIAVIGTGASASKGATTSVAASAESKVAASANGASAPQQESKPEVVVASTVSTSEVSTTAEGRVKASPLARRIAEEHGIDLGQIKGTGPSGRIVRDDLEDYLSQQRATTPVAPAAAPAQPIQAAPQFQAPAFALAAIPEDSEVITISSVQKRIANRLLESKQFVPHFYVSNEIDMTDALALRQVLNGAASEEGAKVSVNDLIIKACALALEKFPDVNGSYRDGQFIRHKHINIGVAVDVPNALVVPVIKDANIKGVRTIAREVRELIQKARNNKLSVADLSGGTFSISNLGMMDVSGFSAIINPPEAAILAVASTRKTFVPVDGQPVIRDIMPLTLSADHRILYGAMVARFLQEVKRLLQNPYALLG